MVVLEMPVIWFWCKILEYFAENHAAYMEIDFVEPLPVIARLRTPTTSGIFGAGNAGSGEIERPFVCFSVIEMGQ